MYQYQFKNYAFPLEFSCLKKAEACDNLNNRISPVKNYDCIAPFKSYYPNHAIKY
jgi:hypothetical protein